MSQQQQSDDAWRYLSAMQALAWASQFVRNDNDREHLAHLRRECGIGEKELDRFLQAKEAA